MKIVVLSNFIANEIRDSLNVWFNTMDISADLILGPYDSTIQQLLDTAGLLADADFTVIVLQIGRWCPPGRELSRNAAIRNIDTFIAAAKFAAVNSPRRPLLIISCPIPSGSHASKDISFLENRIRTSLMDLANVDLFATRELDIYYPVDDLSAYCADDAVAPGEESYSQLFFATLGTIVARCLHKRFRESRKVIVVDCDNTLWSGICGELPPGGVDIREGNRVLQELLFRQSNSGQLICLCSKNDEADVFAVFEQHPGMILRRENLASHRINWLPKADNLLSLSQELGLPLDTFLYIDDDSFECDSISSVHPSVRTIQVPSRDQYNFSKTVLQIWDLDRLAVTDEDEMRVVYYQRNAQRDRASGAALSLDEFLKTLDLRVDILPLQKNGILRAAQLLRRVNQFNLNGIRRSEAELESLSPPAACCTVHAADRFGDYGMVGVMIYHPSQRILRVETMVLSCRALGRGVEHHLAMHLLETARSLECSQISFDLRSTSKNTPLRGFLAQLGALDVERNECAVVLETLSGILQAI